MNRNMKKMEFTLSTASEARLWNYLSHRAFAFLAILGLLFVTANANAACGYLGGARSKNAIKLPMLGQPDEGNFLADHGSSDSIVGLWHVLYTANGATFNETLDQWHNDGTEFENANLSPVIGDICFGVWKQIGPRTIRLHHIGWQFNNPYPDAGLPVGSVSGTFTLDETNTVSRDGKTYSGTFTFKTYDIDGKFTGIEITGTIAATRITVS